MKNILSAILCTVLILFLNGCTSLGDTDFTSTEVEVSEIVEYETVKVTESAQTSKPNSTIASQQIKISKVTKVGETEVKEDYVLADDERLENIDGKTYIFKFKEKTVFSGSKEDGDVKYANVYISKSDSTEVWFDCETDTMLKYLPGKYKDDSEVAREIDDSEKITDEEAYRIAKSFVKNYVNISEYNLTPIEYSDYYEEFTVRYKVYIKGYKTSRELYVELAKNGEITYFYNYPYNAFNGIDVTSVNEKAIVERLKVEMFEMYGNEMESCEITDKRLDVYDGKAVLILEVEMVEPPGISLHQRKFGHTVYYPISLKDYSKVKGTITLSWKCK